MRDITIKPALNGYVVRLGCQRLVFPNRELLMRALNDYLDNPEKTEQSYMYGSLNSKQLGFERNRRNDETVCVSAPACEPYTECGED